MAASTPSNWPPLPYFNLTAGRTPGRYRNSRRASGVLRASRWEASGPRGSASRRGSAQFSTPIPSSLGRALRGWAEGPARRPGDPTGRKSITHLLIMSVGFVLGAPLMRRCARGRRPKGRKSTAKIPALCPPKEQTQPKAQPNSPPRVRLTAAPLSLRRCRSALERWPGLLLNVARWDFISILLTAKRAKSLFKRAGDGFRAPARFILFRLTAGIVESLL